MALAAFGAEPIVLQIDGVDKKLETNIRASLTLTHENAGTTPARMKLAEQRAEEEIKTALQPYGYYRPKITGSIIRQKNNWLARFRIDPGPPIKLTDVHVTLKGAAEASPDMRKLVEHYPLKSGDVLDQTLYEKGKKALRDMAAELGFFDAQFVQHQIRVNLKGYQAAIEITMDSGRRYSFGDVIFSHTPLSDELLRRYLNFAPGDPFRASVLIALQKNLLNSGYFTKADIIPQHDHARDGLTPIDVDLTMAPHNRYDLGAGFGTDTGPRVSLGYRNRYINTYGHSFQANARLSFIWNEIDAQYAIPLDDPAKDQMAFLAKTGFQNTLAGESKLVIGGVRHTTTRWGLREIATLDFHRENFKISGVNQTTNLLIPSLNYTWLETDDDIYPTRGFRIDGNLAGAVQGFISELSFARFRLFGKWLYSFNSDNYLIARGQIAELITNDFDNLPITQRLYSGGDQSVRGYRFNEIAPKNAQGDLIGGRHLMVGSIEYDRIIYGNWGMAIFSDVGEVFNDQIQPYRLGVGAGVRWRSPIGPVRLDIGVPLSKALDPVQVHFVLGPDL